MSIDHFGAWFVGDLARCHCGITFQSRGELKTHLETVSETVSETCPTPHHTTPSNNRTPVVTEDWGSPAARAAAADIHPLDALTVAVGWLRPDWDHRQIRTVLGRMTVPWRARALAALRAATDEAIRTPWAIENLDTRPYEPTPAPPRLAALRTAERCPWGAVHDPHPCAMCRAGIDPEESA